MAPGRAVDGSYPTTTKLSLWMHLILAIPFDFVLPLLAGRDFLRQERQTRLNARRHRIKRYSSLARIREGDWPRVRYRTGTSDISGSYETRNLRITAIRP
jgi:hypothetical protein